MKLFETFKIHAPKNKVVESKKSNVSFKLALPFDQYWNPKKTKEGTHGIDNTQRAESEEQKGSDNGVEQKDKGINQGSAQTSDESGQAKANKIILDNPQISAPTLLNTLKSQGVKLVDTIVDSNEADSASANAQALRSKESGNLGLLHEVKFMESDNPKDGVVGFTKFRCVIIKEGMGNMRDAFYYSREALQNAVSEFEGKKIFADHPSETEEMSRPERSVRDVLGHFENVAFVENEDGQGQLEADVMILPQESFRWARGLLTHAVEYAKKYPDKEFVGLSINASGEAEPQPIDQVIESAPGPAKLKLIKARDEMGLGEVRVVTKIEDAISCDLVTEAGAGGKILSLIEQEKGLMKKRVKESEKDRKPVPMVDPKDQKAPPEAHAEAAPADGEKHDDQAQDIELIKKMISKYLGDGKEIEESEAHKEAMNIAKECYNKAKEKGLDHEAALKCAEVAVEVAKGRAESQESEESEESEESHKESEESEESHKESEESHKESEESEEKKESHKESDKVVALTGKVAFLEGELKKFKLEKHLNTLCESSGLPMQATKKFRALESVKTARSEKELDGLMVVYKEAYGVGGGEAADVYDFVIQTEKTTFKEGNGTKISFEDCLK